MTYLELYHRAGRLLDDNKITLGEYEKMIEPLEREIAEWIPVSERPPKDGVDVLVYDDSNEKSRVGIDSIADASYWWLSRNVTHWMPLPKPPKTKAD